MTDTTSYTKATITPEIPIVTPAAFLLGCTNPNADNFNPSATQDDGSCIISGCTNSLATNFNSNANVDDGSCIYESNEILFDTANKKIIQTKIGANIYVPDASSLAGWTTLAQGLGFQTYYYNTFDGVINDTAATKLKTFLTAVGVNDLGVLLPVRNADFLTFQDWLIATFPQISFIQLDQESQLKGTLSNGTYLTNSHAAINHAPTKTYSWDTALIDSGDGLSTGRNDALVPETGADMGRQYEFIYPDQAIFTTDQIANLALLNDYNNVRFAQLRNLFTGKFPNIQQMNILQMHVENTSKSASLDVNAFISEKPLGNWQLGEWARLHLTNTETYPYVYYMRLSNLMNQTTGIGQYNAMKRIIPAFKFLYSIPITLPHTALSGIGLWDGANSWGMLIMNQASTSPVITPSDINITGFTVASNFTNNFGTATTWDDPVTNGIDVAVNATIKPNSVNFITFTTTGVAANPTSHQIFPNATDPAITLSTNTQHYTYSPAVALNKLLVFFPGSGSQPSGTQKFMETAQAEGFHVIGLMYVNQPNGLSCSSVPAPTNIYLDQFCQEVLFGTTLSVLTNVNVANSIENRLIKLLTYLDIHYPTEGWAQYLSAGAVVWSKVIASGHSQGGDHAAFLGKYRALDRVICASSPREICGNSYTTAWGTFLTPISKYHFFTHTLDSYSDQQATLANMSLNNGVIDTAVNIDSIADQTQWFNFLITSRTPITTSPSGIDDKHRCTLTDAYTPMTAGVPDYKPVWIKLLESLVSRAINTATFTVTPYGTTDISGNKINIVRRFYVITIKDVGLRKDRKLIADTRTYTIVKIPTNLKKQRKISAIKLMYTVSAVAVNFAKTGFIQPAKATYLFTPNDVGLRKSGSAVNYTDVIFTDLTKTTVQYTSGLFLNIYVPTADTNLSAPFWIVCPPGGGDYTEFTTNKYAKNAAMRGYRGIAIDIGSTGGSFDPDKQRIAVIYAWRATRWAKAHAATYTIDASKGVISGQSAGGLTVFQAAIAMNNSADPYFAAASNSAINLEDSGFTNTLLGSASAPGAAMQLYLDNFLEGTDVPHYSWHGDQDHIVPLDWDQNAVDTMISKGIASTISVLTGEDHRLNADTIIPQMAVKFAALL